MTQTHVIAGPATIYAMSLADTLPPAIATMLVAACSPRSYGEAVETPALVEYYARYGVEAFARSRMSAWMRN